ncbi:hypothetical protein ABTF75_19175, partial [Acinetobacter baumannii]
AEWGDGHAGAWLWDQGAVEAAIADAGEDPEAVLIVPETAVQQPGTSGARLLRLNDGYEGQAWQNGLLRASRYWLSPPSADEW